MVNILIRADVDRRLIYQTSGVWNKMFAVPHNLLAMDNIWFQAPKEGYQGPFGLCAMSSFSIRHFTILRYPYQFHSTIHVPWIQPPHPSRNKPHPSRDKLSSSKKYGSPDLGRRQSYRRWRIFIQSLGLNIPTQRT